jgi:hypothetical protein
VAPQHGGAECPKTTETQECNAAPCPSHCEVTEWEEWSPCSVSCGHGSHSRSRAEVVSPAHGGEACPALHQEGFCGEPCPSDTPACEFFSYKFKDTSKWHFNMKVECPACPVTGVRVKLPNGLWAGTFPHWDPEYEGYYHVNNVEIVFPLTVRLVSGSGAVGEEIEETIQELVNDQPIEGTKQFKRCNAEEPAAVQPAFDCIVGVCVTPATILHAIDQYGPPGGEQSVLSEASCREACTLTEGCTYSSYCPPSDPACVLATDDMNEALISTEHVRRCILYAGCSAGTLRPANEDLGTTVPYVSCPRDVHFQMVEAGCTDTLDPSCEAR